MSVNLSELIEQLKNANNLGRKNLEQFGIFLDASMSTYDIMDAISTISENKIVSTCLAKTEILVEDGTLISYLIKTNSSSSNIKIKVEVE
jgi:hypothetical protein